MKILSFATPRNVLLALACAVLMVGSFSVTACESPVAPRLPGPEEDDESDEPDDDTTGFTVSFVHPSGSAA